MAKASLTKFKPDGSLIIDATVNAKIAVPANVNALSPTLQTEAAALQTKLATAVIISS